MSLKEYKNKNQILDLVKKNKYFIINDNLSSSIIVKARESINLPIIKYFPMEEGVHEAYLYIKNNLSILEVVKLKGFGVKGKLDIINIPEKEFLMHKSIETNIKGSEINLIMDENILVSKYKENYDMLNDKFRTFVNGILSVFGKNLSFEITKTFYKSFILKNTGNTTIVINNSFFGNSRQPFISDYVYMNLPSTIMPNESIKLNIKFENDLSLIKSRKRIIITTDTGLQEFYLISQINKSSLNLLYRKNLLDS